MFSFFFFYLEKKWNKGDNTKVGKLWTNSKQKNHVTNNEYKYEKIFEFDLIVITILLIWFGSKRKYILNTIGLSCNCFYVRVCMLVDTLHGNQIIEVKRSKPSTA